MDNWIVSCPECGELHDFNPANERGNYDPALDDITDGRVEFTCDWCGDQFYVVAQRVNTLEVETL